MTPDRQSYLGGSDIGAIAGLDRFRTALDIYQQKRGEAPPTEMNPHMQRGITLEPHIKEIVREETGYGVRTALFRRHPDLKWAGGTPDGYLYPALDSQRETRGILEVKAPTAATHRKVCDEGPFPAWIMQWQWYSMLTGSAWGIIASFCADEWHLKTFEVEADPDLQHKLVTLGNSFWIRMKQGQAPVEGEDIEPIEIPKIPGEAHVRDDAEWAEVIESYRSAHVLKVQAEELEGAAKARIRELAGGWGRFVGGGGTVSYSLQQGRESFQRKRFEIEHPGLDLAPYYKRGQPFEKLLVNVGNKR